MVTTAVPVDVLKIGDGVIVWTVLVLALAKLVAMT